MMPLLLRTVCLCISMIHLVSVFADSQALACATWMRSLQFVHAARRHHVEEHTRLDKAAGHIVA